MNTLKVFFFGAFIVAVALAAPNKNNEDKSARKPEEWLSQTTLQSLPAVGEVTWQRLESMSLQDGAKLMQQLYHLAQINHDLRPSFVPSPSNIPAYIYKSNGEKISANLNNLVETAKQQDKFGEQEITVIITGLPQQQVQTASKATTKLVQAYLQRYNRKNQQQQEDKKSGDRSSSEEDYESQNQLTEAGNVVVIDLGAVLTNFKRFAMLDVEQTGAMIGDMLVQWTNEGKIPQEIINIVAQGIAAHVAGAAGRQYTRLTGHKLRRITALDPSRVYAKNPNNLSGLARNDAEFVDAIHTSAYGMGTPMRVADVDFFPNGPSAGVPGATNVIEAAMRATRYFAETVRPGNKRNFPAVAANSLQQYKNNNGNGQRALMGIATEFDVRGDYILEVNAKSPFGKRTPAQRQNTYHGVHQGWKNSQNN